MNFHNTTSTYGSGRQYGRPTPKMSFTQTIRLGDFTEIFRETAGLIRGTGKVACLAVAFVIIVNYAIVSAIGSIDHSIEGLKDARHTLLDKNIEYRAEKAHISDPLNLGKLAQDQLSLGPATKEQIGVFDRRKGIFRQGLFNQETKTFVYL